MNSCGWYKALNIHLTHLVQNIRNLEEISWCYQEVYKAVADPEGASESSTLIFLQKKYAFQTFDKTKDARVFNSKDIFLKHNNLKQKQKHEVKALVSLFSFTGIIVIHTNIHMNHL